MSEYTLNDQEFNPTPLTLFASDPSYKPAKEALKKGFQRNRELLHRMEEKNNGDDTGLSARR